MKINKNIFICALLVLMLLLCVNASSAEDSFDMELAIDDSSDVVNSPVEIEDTIASDSEENNDEISSPAVGSSDGGENVLSEGNSSQETIVITSENFNNYFNEKGNLNENVSEGSTLDFQGSFIGKFTVNIDKPVNVISSTGDAVFDAGEKFNGNAVNCFNVVEGGDYTNVTGLKLINTVLFVEAPHVNIDGLKIIATMRGVGSGQGLVSIRKNAGYTTFKNCYLEQGGTSSSIVVIGFGSPYVTIDNNYINITGTSGNILGANAYVGSGVTPDHMLITNNIIKSNVQGSSTMLGFTLVGSYNVVLNNTLDFKGTGLTAANMQWAPAGIPKDPQENNTIKDNTFIGASLLAVKGSVVENNYVEAAFNINGADVVATGNTIIGTATIAAAAKNTTFTDNYVYNGLTVNSNDNTITNNQIASTGAYAIDLKSTQNNTVKDNFLSSKDKMGDEAVKVAAGKVNNVSSNKNNAIIEIAVGNSWIGNKNNVTVTVVNATGSVTIKINGKEYETLPLENNKATFEINASEIQAGLNDVTATYNGSEEIMGDSKDTTFYGLDNVVFQEVFFEFFDHDGCLKEDVPYTDLIFKGTFAKSSTVQYIVIDKPLTITADEASLSLIGMVIGADDVVIDGLKFSTTVNSATSALGDLITVNANNVTLTNLDINYRVTRGDYDAIAINVFGDVEDIKITNNKIIFASVISSDDYSANAINLDGVSNALIDNNTITSTLPGLLAENYDLDYFMMGLNTVNPVRMREVEDSVFSRNTIESNINNLGKTTPTIQCLLIVGSQNVLFDSNSFRMVDTKTKSGDATFLYALNFGYDENITLKNNDFYMSTTGGKDSAGSAYALQGVESEINIIGNTITSISNGPNLGIYVASMMGGTSELYIAGNTINITGYATSSSSYALVSGIEITNGAAQIYENTIYTYNKAGYIEQAPVYGVSYAQYMNGERCLDVQNNTMNIQGKYTVSVIDGTECDVIGNILYAEDLIGDDSVAPGYDGIVENNTPPFDPEIIVECETVWTGSDSTVTVNIPGATGNVTIKVGNRIFNELQLENNTVTQVIDAADLIGGANDIIVTFNGEKYYKAATEIFKLQVLDGIITNETYQYYFDASGNMVDIVPEGVTLDFQGLFLGKYPVYINKAVNVISSTDDALFDCGDSYSGNNINSFNLIAGADHSNITGLKFINYCLYIKGASYVAVDGVSIVANKRSVGSGTGFLSIHTGAYYTTVKNGYFENGGTGSSLLVLGKGGAYVVFDHNIFNITGNSGNVISANQFVGTGDAPEHTTYTNNLIYSNRPASAICYAMTVSGSGNLIENNTIYFNGAGILNQYGATSTGNVYRNNTIYGSATFNPSANSLVENNKNYGTGQTTIAAGTTVINNIFNKVTISGANVVAKENTFNKGFTISGKNITFTDNTVLGTLTVSSNENTITKNNITSTDEYAIDLKSTNDNTVTENRLVAKSIEGDGAVKYSGNNVVKDNYRYLNYLTVNADNIFVGGTAVINVNINNHATGNVQVILDGKRYILPIENGAASINVTDLKVSQYTVAVIYDGDQDVMQGRNSTTFTVSKLKSDVVITTSDLNIGEDVNVTVSIEGATGSVTLVVDGSSNTLDLIDGVATYTIKAVTAGTHSLTAIYMGDASHDFATNTTKFTIDKIATSINLSDMTVEYGTPIPISFVIGEDATGKVYIITNGVKSIETLKDGAVNFTLEGLARGVYTMSLSYEGDAKYLACDKTIEITVNGTSAGLKANATDIKVGENATINVEINSDATGAVVIILDKEYAVNIVDGKGSIVLSGLSNGTYTATVKYDGDKEFYADEITVNFTVSKEEIPSDINVSMDIPEGTTAPEFTINLPSDATGNFSVTIDNQTYSEPLVNGSATVKVPELTVGNHTISTSYSGDDKYGGFASNQSTVNIPKASIPGGEDALNLTSPEGSDSPTYSINLPGATGNLTVNVDGKDTYTQALVNGSASVTVPGLSEGDHNITVTYSGDNKFSSISKNTTYHVPIYRIAENKDVSAIYSATASYKVLITKDGKAVGAGESVVITFNGKKTNVTTDSNGYATLKLNTQVKVKTYPITAEYKDQKVTNKVAVKHVIKAANKKVKKSKKVTKVKVSLKKVNGKVLKSKTLKIKFNKKTYKVKTNKKGVAIWKVKKSMVKKLKVGKKYSYTVTYGKDVVTKKLTIKK